MKKVLIVLAAVAIFLLGTTVYYGYNYSTLKEKSKCESNTESKSVGVDNDKDENEEPSYDKEEENDEPSYDEDTYDRPDEEECNDYIDYVYPLISKANETGFIKKYYPEDYITIKKDDIKCNNIKEINNLISGVYYDVSISEGKGFQCFLEKEKCYEYTNSYGSFSAANQIQAFMYAKNMVENDFDELNKKYKSAGLYPTKYTGGDTLNLEVREYKGEYNYSGELYVTYIVNFKTRTFIKK